MPVPSVRGNFADLLDPRFAKIFDDRWKELPDRVGDFFRIVDGASAPTRDTYRVSEMGTLPDLVQSSTVEYLDSFQGYDGTITPLEYTGGYQIERKMFEDDLYGVMDGKPSSLATSVIRTRQKHAAQLFNNIFSVDLTWNNYTENKAICSDSHTTTATDVSTATGFDNLSTASLSAVAVAAGRVQMRNFRGDRGQRISVMPDSILVPVDLEEAAWEIVNSSGKLDTANNNANFNRNRYKVVDWEYLTDANNWYMYDAQAMKDALVWVDRVKAEHANVEDFDTFVAKWRVYCRYGQGHNSWRWVLGFQVS